MFCLKQFVCVFMLFMVLVSCNQDQKDKKEEVNVPMQATVKTLTKSSLVVLGNVQDAGFPQIGCTKSCCVSVWGSTKKKKMVVSLGIVDTDTKKTWLFDASPDFKDQTKMLSDYAGNKSIVMPDGIFLTHAHMGHYTGLIHLGREAMGADQVPVFVMPKMYEYLSNNGPWSQLIKLKNIELVPLQSDSGIQLTSEIKVTPFFVPHRGEYTETVGYKIEGKNQRVLFIPDIDKWSKWNRSIVDEIKAVDVAFLDATFFKNGEVGNRDMSEIPHPFVEESIRLFNNLPSKEREKIHFIHMNHTNPLLQENSEARKEVFSRGYHIAEEGLAVEL
ncbi:MAG: pyrroloquinoline quinone biosynthesis protein PqqB [Flavobacteriales bacterium]|nr:pyrroloquinoline quinone biosynthesis protein PqqB [Flavobacteriales bacterium]